MEQITGIDPLYAIGSNISVNNNVRTKADAQKEFASVFVAQILKEVYKGQSEMFGEEGSLGLFSDNLYNDIMMSKISSEIAGDKSFGFEKLLMQ